MTKNEQVTLPKVWRDPRAPIEESPLPEYHRGLALPENISAYTFCSFYKFHKIDSPEAFTERLFELWKPFGAQGRVYVAREVLYSFSPAADNGN